MRNYFNNYLKKVSIVTWILKMIPIPVGIIIAKISASITQSATEGEIKKVFNQSLMLIGFVLVIKIFQIITDISYQKALSQALHKCKMFFYNHVLSNPLHVLYASEYGVVMENLNNDFDTLSNRTLNLLPNFWIGIVTTITYCIFLGLQSPIIALSLIIISLLQIIPPLIVKRYMQMNYDNCREIEAQITNHILEGYHGFTTIKLYELKQWWLEKMRVFHNKYSKIGSMSIYTNTAENIMDNLLDNILKYGTYGIIGMFVLVQYTSLDVAIEAIILSGGLFTSVKTIFDLIPSFAVVKTAEKRMSVWFNNKEQQYDQPKGTLLSLCDVSLSFEGKNIFHQVNCLFEADKLCVIKGSNGIGKSTLFKMMTGLLKSDKGTIKIGGVAPECINEEAFLKTIFYLPQEDAMFNFTPEELYKMMVYDKQEQAIDCAKSFGLTEEIIRCSKINALSGGERKKIFLALALTLNTPILLLDEPTNSLDEQSKKVLCNSLRNRESGALVITHDDAFDGVAEHVYTIVDGAIYCAKTK